MPLDIDEKTRVSLYAVLSAMPIAVVVLLWTASVKTDSANALMMSHEALGIAKENRKVLDEREAATARAIFEIKGSLIRIEMILKHKESEWTK